MSKSKISIGVDDVKKQIIIKVDDPDVLIYLDLESAKLLARALNVEAEKLVSTKQ